MHKVDVIVTFCNATEAFSERRPEKFRSERAQNPDHHDTDAVLYQLTDRLIDLKRYFGSLKVKKSLRYLYVMAVQGLVQQ